MLRQIPNILTFGRLILTMIFLGLLLYRPQAANRSTVLDVAFVIFIVAGITDILDGIAARGLNVTSKFGRMLDPLVDKVLVCGTFICFALIGQPLLFGWSAATVGTINWSVAGIITAREVYVTVLRHIAESKGINFAASATGKAKMFVQSFAIGTVIVKAAHVQTAAWGNYFTATVYILMLAATVASGVAATRRGVSRPEAAL